jgi:hypothetical protein
MAPSSSDRRRPSSWSLLGAGAHQAVLRALEDENRRLKKLLAEQMLDNAALKDLVGKNF